MSHLLSRPDYEQWLYAIPETYASVRSSTVRFFFTQPNLPFLIREVEQLLEA